MSSGVVRMSESWEVVLGWAYGQHTELTTETLIDVSNHATFK